MIHCQLLNAGSGEKDRDSGWTFTKATREFRLGKPLVFAAWPGQKSQKAFSWPERILSLNLPSHASSKKKSPKCRSRKVEQNVESRKATSSPQLGEENTPRTWKEEIQTRWSWSV